MNNRAKLYRSIGSAAIIKSFFVALWLIFNSTTTNAQDCTKSLEQARNFYKQGLIERVPKTLEECLKDGFTKSQKTEAYQLLVLTYQFDNKPEQAQDTYIDLLKHDPEFTLNAENTPSELMRLYNTFHAPPIYSVGILAGVNYAFGQRTQSFNLSDSEDELSNYSNNGIGFQVGITVKKYISKRFELNADILYKEVKYQKTLNQLEFAEVIFKEDQRQLNLPLTVTYDFQLGRFSPYLRLGGGLSYLLASEALVERIYLDESVQNLPNVTGPAIDVQAQRNNINFFSSAGIGLKFKIPRGVIVLDARHNWYFLDQNRPSKRFNNNVLVYEYLYIDDDFKLGNVAISLGYTYSFHKIKIIKKKKVTSSKE